MSTVSRHPAPKSRPAPAEPDPFRFGWRYVPTTRADGTESLDQVPLTLEDVLHPEAGDIIVETDPHDSDRAYLKAVCKTRLIGDTSAVVLSDCQVDFNIPNVKPLCPDLAVFLGARRQIAWTSFNVAKEGARAAMVVEVTSPDTRTNDVGIKVDYYHRAGVPVYVVADVLKEGDGQRRIELVRYDRSPRRYKRVKPDKRGWIWLAPVGLWLGLTHDRIGGFVRLACFDPDTGKEVGDYTAISEQLAESEQRVLEAEARAADELRRADAEQRRADAEHRRADAEHLRADAEARARANAEERIRELEAALKKSRGRKS